MTGPFARGLKVDSDERGDFGIVEDAEKKVVGADPTVATPACLVDAEGDRVASGFCESIKQGTALLSVLCVDRLPGDPECVADLFPGPSVSPSNLDMCRLDLFGQAMKRAD